MAHAAPSLSLPVRQQLYRDLMATELEVSSKVNDPLILKALQKEGNAQARQRGQASLTCSLMDRIEALDERQQPVRKRLQARLRQKYRVSQATLDAVLQEGQTKNWKY